MKKVSIILPIFNNYLSLPILFSEIENTIQILGDRYQFEMVLIDDGSIDSSWIVAKEYFGNQVIDVKAIKLVRNFGQVAAVMAGWENCSGDLIINMSADLQDPVELIPRLLKKFEEGSEIVLGQRLSKGDGLVRKITGNIATKILLKSLHNEGLVWFDVSLMTKKVLQTVLAVSGPNRFYQRDILHAGYSFSSIGYHRAERVHGKSGFSQGKRLKLFTDALLDSAHGLVHFFSIGSVVVTASTFIYGMWIVIARSLNLIRSDGWAPIMVAILFSTSFICLLLAIVAEYLWRIYEFQRGRQLYVVEDQVTSLGGERTV